MDPLVKKILFGLGVLITSGSVFLFFQEPKLVSTTHFLSPAGKKPPLSSPAATPFNPEKLIFDLKAYLATQSGHWGVNVTLLTPDHQPEAEKTFGLDQNQSFPAASVMKVLVAANLINRVDKKEFSLEKMIKDQTLVDLMEKMINRTDNDAWSALNDFLGFNNLQRFGQDLGMETLNVYENTFSPADVNLLLVSIYQNKVASANLSQLLLSFMENTETEDRIPAAAPTQTKVYHKTGTWAETGTFSDAGIIAAENPLVLTFLSENVSSHPQAIETIKTLTEKIFNYFGAEK